MVKVIHLFMSVNKKWCHLLKSLNHLLMIWTFHFSMLILDSLSDVRLHEIMIVFIIFYWPMDICFDEYNRDYHNSLQVRLIRGIDHLL